MFDADKKSNTEKLSRDEWKEKCRKELGIDPDDYDDQKEFVKVFNAKMKRKLQRITESINDLDNWRNLYEYDDDEGPSPYNFDTEEEYIEARMEYDEEQINKIHAYYDAEIEKILKESYSIEVKSGIPYREVDEKVLAQEDIVNLLDKRYYYCAVLPNNATRLYYYQAHDNIRIGDKVCIPFENRPAAGIVVSVEEHTAISVPSPIEETRFIIGKI